MYVAVPAIAENDQRGYTATVPISFRLIWRFVSGQTADIIPRVSSGNDVIVRLLENRVVKGLQSF